MNMRLVSLILGLLTCLPLCSSGDQEIQARFEKSLKDARSISNVEIQMIDTFWLKQSDEPEVFRTFRYSYVASGQRYRTVCKLISSTATNTPTLFDSAFDGTSYANFDTDSRYMTLRKKSPSRDRGENSNNPLIAPFMFLSKYADGCEECGLRFSDIISFDITNGLVVSKAELNDDVIQFFLPGLPLIKQPTVWKVAIQKAGDSFTPKMISRLITGAGVEMVYRLHNYTNLGAYQFPNSIEWSVSAYPPTSPLTLISTGMVTVISARIPEQIADSVFRLDDEAKSAAVVWDWDQHKVIHSAPGLVKAGVRSRTTRNVLLLLMLSTTVIISIVVAKTFISKTK